MTHHEVVRWVIVGKHGLYCGQHMRRVDAIAEHVAAIYSGREFGQISPFAFGGRLSADQARAWRLARRQGDRARPALIQYWLPE